MKLLWELFLTFAKVGVMTFGGGMAMLPILQREVVENKGWATDEELVDYFAIGQCTPGIIAVNTATFVGQKQRGVVGGIAATLGIVFPSLLIITVLAGVINSFSHLDWVQHAFAGIRVCVCVLIFNAVLKLLKKSVVDKRTAAIFLIVMALLAAVVYAALHFFEAGYGYLFDRRYGPPVPNRVGWMVMESPVFILMCVLWASSERMWQAGPLALFCLFQAHYLQRAFIFPLLIRGKGRMPLGIVVMGMVFNTLNALMQGGWIFYVSPADYYAGWFAQPYIYIGGALFVAGMAVNLHSDHIIRHLRRPGDTRHYIPRGGMFRYVSSANYFGELLEWVGFAVASWSWAGTVFAWWTFANLAPRAASLRRRYEQEFGEEFSRLRRKRIIPFIY